MDGSVQLQPFSLSIRLHSTAFIQTRRCTQYRNNELFGQYFGKKHFNSHIILQKRGLLVQFLSLII